MNPAPAIPQGMLGEHWSISTFAAETGRTRETVSKRISASGILPSAGDPKRGNAVYRVKQVLPLLFHGTDEGEIDPERLEPHSRKAHYEAERTKRALLVDAKRLFWDYEVEDEIAGLFKLVAQTLDTLPDVLERDAGLKPEHVALVEKRIDEVRSNLADEIGKRPPAERDAPRQEAAVNVDALFA